MLAPAFLKGDTNGDKQLSQAEFAALGEKWFGDWDTKNTGKLGTDELRGGVVQLFAGGMGNAVQIGGPRQGPGMNFVAAEGRRNRLAGAAGIDFPYVHSDLDFDGLALRDVAVRYKGNGTFMQSRNQDKKSLKLDLNKYVKGQKIAGLTKLNFHSGVTDASWMNEGLSCRTGCIEMPRSRRLGRLTRVSTLEPVPRRLSPINIGVRSVIAPPRKWPKWPLLPIAARHDFRRTSSTS